jgi:hypothetical protein
MILSVAAGGRFSSVDRDRCMIREDAGPDGRPLRIAVHRRDALPRVAFQAVQAVKSMTEREKTRRRGGVDEARYKARAAEAEDYRKLLVEALMVKEPNKGGVDTVTGAMLATTWFHMVLYAWHEEDTVKSLLPSSSAALNRWKDELILRRYDAMATPSVQQLARQLAAENVNLPEEKRWGRGTTNPMAMDKHIRRRLNDREEYMRLREENEALHRQLDELEERLRHAEDKIRILREQRDMLEMKRSGGF